MICVKCGAWHPDVDGDTCPECQRRSKRDAQLVERELELNSSREQDPLAAMRADAIRRYEAPNGIRCQHLHGCSIQIISICTCGLLFDLCQFGTQEAVRLYSPFLGEITAQGEAAERLL